MSLWNQLVKSELRMENGEQAKSLHVMMKSTKQELNLTLAYSHLEAVSWPSAVLGTVFQLLRVSGLDQLFLKLSFWLG